MNKVRRVSEMDPTEREDVAFVRRKPLVDVAAQASSCEAGGAASEGDVGESLKTRSGSGTQLT